MGPQVMKFVYGALAFLASYAAVSFALSTLYALASKPFYGSITAGIVFGLLQGLLSLLLCRTILARFVESRLADNTTLVVAGVSFVALSASAVWGLASGRLSESPGTVLPTIAGWLPWIAMGIYIGRTRLSGQAKSSSPAEQGAPPDSAR